MPLLSEILNEHIHATNFLYKREGIDFVINIEVSEELGYYFYFYFSRIYSDGIKNRLKILKELDDNIFINESLKLQLQEIFCKIQKTYYSFSKLAYIWRYKTSKILVDNDLSLNPIDINKKNVFVLFQNNSRYLFTTNDLINIINTNLSNSPNFFCNPLWPKNPYNNILFSNADFYNIYFFLKFKVYNVPLLLELFFKSNFNLTDFAFHNECVIRSFKIDNYVKSSDNDTLYKNITKMMSENIDITNNIKISPEFPKDLLVQIMRPYLHLYIISKFYIIGTEKWSSSERILRRKLNNFALYNPLFGRKTVKIKNIFGKITEEPYVIFNDKHINFHENNGVDPENRNDNSDSEGEGEGEGEFVYDNDSNEDDLTIEINRNLNDEFDNNMSISYDDNDSTADSI